MTINPDNGHGAGDGMGGHGEFCDCVDCMSRDTRRQPAFKIQRQTPYNDEEGNPIWCPECGLEKTSVFEGYKHFPRCQFHNPPVNLTLEYLLQQGDDFHMCRPSRGYACPVCGKHARYCGHTKADMIIALQARDTTPAPAGERWPTLEAIGLFEALDQVEAVAATCQPKHPGKKWLTKSITHHDAKAIKHLGTVQCGQQRDLETGQLGRAHAALRLLMSLGLELFRGR